MLYIVIKVNISKVLNTNSWENISEWSNIDPNDGSNSFTQPKQKIGEYF